jgi:predicted Rossmann-fold nucleotide-binding protein
VMLKKEGNISAPDMNLFRVADTADEVVEHFNRYYSKHPLQPNF